METNTVRELVYGTVGVDRRGFAEQNHRDGAKRNRDDRLSIEKWSFDERSESNFLSVCKDLCEVLKVQKKNLKNKR